MNEHEKTRIAAAINQLRPDWPAGSLRSLLDRPQITNRPRRDVAVALAWIACEAETSTPARVFEAGPWWQAAAIDGPTSAPAREPYDPATFCGICSQPEHRCRSNENAGHEYVSSVEVARDANQPKQPIRELLAAETEGASE